MSRYPGWHNESDVQRHLQRMHGPQAPQQLRARARRPVQHSTMLSSVRRTETGWIMTYVGWLPRISNKQVHPLAVWRLTKRCRQDFGVLPPMLYPQTRARVEVIRVLGPRQKPLDRDKIALTCAGCVDALVPSYIKDDSEKWADITYRNESGRRQEGPCVEIIITYEGEPHGPDRI